MEVVRHDAVGEGLHAGKRDDAPDEVHKPSALVLVKEVRAMGDAAEQVIASVGKMYSATSGFFF